MNQREIKFRCWDIKNKKWGKDFTLSSDGKVLTDRNLLYEGVFETNVILLQFTGLKDSNGVEIYEGDIVNHYDPTMGEKYEDRLQYKTIADIYLPKTLNGERLARLEVIGNIYENPELLTNLKQ